MIKIIITGDSWLDPSTCRIMYDLRNNGKIITVLGGGQIEQILRPLGGPWCFFRRVRILCNGQIIEDIDSYNRCHELFSSLTAKDTRMNENAEGFGKSYDHRDENPASSAFAANNYTGIKVEQSQTVLFKLLSGLLGGQTKYLPIRYAPLTIELELVDNMTDPILRNSIGTLSGDNTSIDWQIENVQLKCDLCTLDNALDNSYAQHLLSGK